MRWQFEQPIEASGVQVEKLDSQCPECDKAFVGTNCKVFDVSSNLEGLNSNVRTV